MNAPKGCDPASSADEAMAGVVEWVAFCAGSTRLIDYQATPSSGVAQSVAQAVVHVCRRFHPEAQPRLLTRSAYLFWRMENPETQAQWAMTRIVPVPLPETERRDFDYMTLLLTSGQLAALGGDPFALVRGDLHDTAMATFHLSRREPLLLSLTASTIDTSDLAQSEPNESETGETEPKVGLVPWSEDAVTDLERSCAFRARRGETPITFATWWLGGQNAPLSLFDIVLTQAESTPAEEGDVIAQAVRLSARLLPVIESGPATPAANEAVTLSRQIAHYTHEAQWTGAQSRDDNDWAARMAQAANDSLSLAGLLHHLEAQTGQNREAGRLAEAYGVLADTLRRQQHPRTGRSVTTAFSDSTASSPTAEKAQKPGIGKYVGILLMLVLTAALSSAVTVRVMQLSKHRAATPLIKNSEIIETIKKNHERNNTKSH